MSIPDHSIVPLTASDVPTIGHFLYSSKLSLTINRLLYKDWPNEANQLANCTSTVESGLSDPAVEQFKVVDGKGEAIGFLALSRRKPGNRARIPNDGGEQNLPDYFVPEVVMAVGRAVKEIDTEVEGIDRYELTFIYVKPSSRRQGIGAQLVRLCLEKAKAAGLPLALGAEPAAYEFFLKQGFKDTKHIDFHLEKWTPPNSGFGVFRLAGMIISN